MSIWKPAPINEEPEILISQWKVFTVQLPINEHKTSHFIGDHFTGIKGRYCGGRVSSAITTFDISTMRGKTASGRAYQLTPIHSDGQPYGLSSDSSYTLNIWLGIAKLTVDDIEWIWPLHDQDFISH